MNFIIAVFVCALALVSTVQCDEHQVAVSLPKIAIDPVHHHAAGPDPVPSEVNAPSSHPPHDELKRIRRQNCPAACPLNYVPTCGFNGRCYKTFSNDCDLRTAACYGQGNFRQVNMMECNKRSANIC